MKSFLKNSSNHLIEQEIFSILIKTEILYFNYFNLLQTNNEIFSRLEFLPVMIIRATTANRLFDQNLVEIRLVQSTITEKTIARKLKQKTHPGPQPQTQSNSGSLNPNISNIEATENMFPAEVTGPGIPTSSAPIPGITIPLQVSTKTIRSNSDNHSEPNTSDMFTSQEGFSGVTSHQFHIQNTANLLISQFIRTQRILPM